MSGLHTLHTVPEALAWLAGHGVRSLTIDSRQAGEGDAFIAWPGQAFDGRRFVSQALQSGASACLIEEEGAEAFEFTTNEAPRIAAWRGLKGQTGPLASAFWQQPSHALQVLAVTGTNGKTSTSWWLAQALGALGRPCGLVGTLGIGQPPFDLAVSQGLTTPDPVTLQAALRRFADQGFATCAMEASSIGLAEQRLAGTRVPVALLTNFTQDHLDYHGDMSRYWAAKSQLFSWPGLQAAVLNLDDTQGAALALQLTGTDVAVWTYAVRHPARLQALNQVPVQGDLTGLGFDVQEEGGAVVPVRTQLIGDYNVANLLAVIGGLRALGVPLAQAAAVCSDLTPVPGRMQRVQAPVAVGGPEVVVDYAHTPDALEKALQALRPFAQARGGKLWCVFGCGGNRDAGKRALMGGQAQRWADRVVLTSDNPRDESPQHILRQIAAGMGPAPTVIEDRAEAIAHAVAEAGASDLILLAGKGHEDYQEVAGVKRPFSDVAHARAALAHKLSQEESAT